LHTSGTRYAKTICVKIWARKNKNWPVSVFFTKIAYFQVMNFIPVKVSTLYKEQLVPRRKWTDNVKNKKIIEM
jgi:hypothetical protein